MSVCVVCVNSGQALRVVMARYKKKKQTRYLYAGSGGGGGVGGSPSLSISPVISGVGAQVKRDRKVI